MPLPSFLGPYQTVPAASVPPGAGGTRSKRLAVSIDQQVPTQWCWAATTAAVSSFYATVHNVGAVLTPCQVATQCLDTPCCPEPTDPNDSRNREYALQTALGVVDHLAKDPAQQALDFAAIMTEIDGDRPICCHISWDPAIPDDGHFNAIIGYDATTQDIDVCDCLYGYQSLPLDKFLTSYRDHGTWDWTYLTS